MPVTTQLRAADCIPVNAVDGGDDAGQPVIDAYGELMRRAMDAPLGFGFVWRGMNFRGTLETIDGGMRLSLQSDLAKVPFSAEDAETRSDLFAVVDTLDGHTEGLLKVVQGQKIVLESEVPMPRSANGNISSVVANLTMLVLNAAPYLDLIAEFTPTPDAA